MPDSIISLNETPTLMQLIEIELDKAEESLKEISLMLDQSRMELTKLAQRNATLTGQIQQVQQQIETMPRGDIRSIYNTALDSQQRLLVMRGQLEKLQSDHANIQKYIDLLKKVRDSLGEDGFQAGKAKKAGAAMLEMVIKAQEAERQRLSRQMHDGPAQALSNFIVQTEIAARMFEMDPTRAKDELNNMKNAAMGTFQKVRAFIFELRPMSLDDLGLFPTVRRYIDAFKDQTGIEVTLNLRGPDVRCEPYLEVMIFRALQELLGNATRHNMDAPNKVKIEVGIALDNNMFKISVDDNGKGFDPATIADSGGFGLKLIRERVDMLGGYMDIDSAIGQGTRVSFQVPCPEPERSGS